MSWRPVPKAVFRLGIVLSVVLSGVTFGVADADARAKVRTIKDRTTSRGETSTRRKSDEHDAQGADGSSGAYVPRVRSREAARGSEISTDADDPTAPRALPPAHAMSGRPFHYIDVPGCPTGMICTVCLAGCSGETGGIVDTQSRMPTREPRP